MLPRSRWIQWILYCRPVSNGLMSVCTGERNKQMKILRWVYPSLVGILLGLLQTGLFFQLTFTLSSSFRTFLMITVCWLLGSAVGIRIAKSAQLQLNGFMLVGM